MSKFLLHIGTRHRRELHSDFCLRCMCEQVKGNGEFDGHFKLEPVPPKVVLSPGLRFLLVKYIAKNQVASFCFFPHESQFFRRVFILASGNTRARQELGEIQLGEKYIM